MHHVGILLVLASVPVLIAAEAPQEPENTVQQADELFDAFCNPPANARPWMRWWWNGNRITTAEIDRQLDAMAAAGVGGVEINPIALPDGSNDVGPDAVEWLSPAWNRRLAHAVEGAHQRGMLVDLIVGSGWPFGGRFLERHQQIQILRTQHLPLAPGIPHRFTRDDLLRFPKQRAGADFADDPPTRIVSLARVPEQVERIDDIVDLRERLTDEGVLELSPAGVSSFLCVAVVQTGFREVVHGAPGADGPVLDHFDAEAVRAYLDRMSSALGPALGGRLGDGLRALFCDSIELGGANWTDDMRAVFAERRGYALEPWLPLIVPDTRGGRRRAPQATASFMDQVRRVRFDFSRTIAELLVERFVETFCQWCREQGTLSRYQAYGTPWLYAMLEGYERPDIPEGDTWIHFPRDTVGARLDGIRYAVWNKAASSAAHRVGRGIVAAEAMTNLNGVFRATLEDLKQAADLDFVTGVTHSVLHGWNHSPREAGFPGWVRYGTYFSDRNPWWPHFVEFADYHARIAAVLQASEARAQVAILGPRADVWSEHGLDRVPLIRTPSYLYEIWQAFQQVGCVADYVTEYDVRSATLMDGDFVCGAMRYELVLLTDVETLAPETAEALHRHVAAGGRVAIVGKVPHRSSSMQDGEAGDRRVRGAIAKLLAMDAKRAARIEAPGEDRIAWADAVSKRFGVRRPITILEPDPYLFQVAHRFGDREIFFVTNLARDRALAPRLHFASERKTIWRWDAERGTRHVLARSGEDQQLPLGPLESALLVLEPETTSVEPATEPPVAKTTLATTDGPWSVTLEPMVDSARQVTLTSLVDFATAEDASLREFSGRITYRIEVDAARVAEARVLDLGTVHGISEAFLDGRLLGVRWWGHHVYELDDAVRASRKPSVELMVRVTTTAANHALTLEDATARRWTRAWMEKGPQPTGLVGPVRWLR